MYVYMYIYVCICIYVCVCMYICIYTQIYLYRALSWVSFQTCTALLNMYVCAVVDVRRRRRIRSIDVYIHIRTYMYIYVYIQVYVYRAISRVCFQNCRALLDMCVCAVVDVCSCRCICSTDTCMYICIHVFPYVQGAVIGLFPNM